MAAGFLAGSFLEKSEAKLKIIKAGVDDKGNMVCINKAQVYLFKKVNPENKIIFHYHDALSKEASLPNPFLTSETWKFIGISYCVAGRITFLPY